MDAHTMGGQYKLQSQDWDYLLALSNEELGNTLSAENQQMCLSVIDYLSHKIEGQDQGNEVIQEAVKIVHCLPEKYSHDPVVLKVINHISTHGGFFVEKGWVGTKIGPLLGYSKHDANQQLVDKIRMSIEQGHGEMALALIESGFPLSDAQRREFLLTACERGETKIVEKLIEQLKKVTYETHVDPFSGLSGEMSYVTLDLEFTGGDFEETPLLLACRFGHADIAMMLIKAGADVNAIDTEGETALFNAFDSGLEEVVAYLINSGANLQTESESGETLYSIVAERLLSNLNVMNSPTAEMDRHLMLLLIEKGADASDFVQHQHFGTIFGDVLSNCIIEGKTNRALHLLKNGLKADPEHLLLSCSKGNELLALQLLHHVGDGAIQFTDQQGNTALHWACRMGFAKLAMELINKGASFQVVNKVGDSPIQEAIRSEVGPVIEYLEKQGVDISSIRWETELKDISRLSKNFSGRISEELGGKSKDSKEAQTIFKLTKILNTFRNQNEQLPPYLQIDEMKFIANLEKAVSWTSKENFFSALDVNMEEMQKLARSKQFAALPSFWQKTGGEQFAGDAAKFCLSTSLSANEKFADGTLSFVEHPFFSAPMEEKIKRVLQAKAEQRGLTKEQSALLFEKVGATFIQSGLSAEEFYRRADSVLSLCGELFEAQNFADKSSMWVQSLFKEGDGASFFNKVASRAVVTWGPILIRQCINQDPVIWQKPLYNLMSLAGSLNSDDIEFDSRVITEVILEMASEHGFPNDVEKFNKLFNDPAAKDFLHQKCIKAAKQDHFKQENMQLWKDKFEKAGEGIAALELFSKEFEPFFQGPVNAKVLSLLVKAALFGGKYAENTEVSPDVFAKGLALYYQKRGSIQKVPDLEEVVPFCKDMPALKGWEGWIKKECGNAVSPGDKELFCALLNENGLFPKTFGEVEIMAITFSEAMILLNEGGYSQSPEARKQVALGCIGLLAKQSKKNEPLIKPKQEALLASFKSNLPEIDGWKNLFVEQNQAFGKLVLQQMGMQGVRGPVNAQELKSVLNCPNYIKVLGLRGYSESVAVCALSRYIGHHFKNDQPLEMPISEKNLFRFCFEACIEDALPNQPRDKIENTIALFSCVKGKELVLGKDGQRRLAFLARKVCSPDFAGGRTPGHFRVVAKFPQIMSALDVNHVKHLNHLPYDEKLLGDLFDEQVAHVFKNLNVRELLDAISVNPNQAIAAVLIPALTTLAADNSLEFTQNIQKLIPLMTSRKEFGDKLQEFNKLLAKLEMVNAAELDLEVTTPDVIAGLLSGLLGMKGDEMASQNSSSKQQEEELVLVRQLFRTLGGIIFDKDQGEKEGMGATGKFFLKMGLTAVAASQSKLTSVVGSNALQYGVSTIGSAVGKWGDFKSYITGDSSNKIDPELVNAMPAMVAVMQKVAVNLLSNVQLKDKQELLNYWINLETEEAVDQRMKEKEATTAESNQVKKQKKEEIVRMLYKSAEVLLNDCQNTLPGLFEGVLLGVKSIPHSHLQQTQGMSSSMMSTPVILEEPATVQENQGAVERQKVFEAKLTKLVTGFGIYLSDKDKFIINNIIPTLSQEMGKGILQKRSLTEDELSEIKKIIDIGCELCEKHNYAPEEIAIACCRFSEDKLKQDKPISAGYIKIIEEKERQSLLPFAFDAVVELQAAKILNTSARVDIISQQPEGHQKQKIQFYLNHECIKGCSVPLTVKGRQSLEEVIKSMLNPKFCTGKNLLDPLVVERMPLILQGTKLSSVQLLNQTDPQTILNAMVLESDVCMKKINIGTLLEVVKKKPLEFMCTLANPVLDVLMEGASFEDEQQAKAMAAMLLTTFHETSAAKSLIKKMETQLGKFDFKGVSFELSVSLSQLLEGLGKDTNMLSKDLESGVMPTVKEAEEYGVIAPALLEFASYVSKLQKERRKPVEARDPELAKSTLMSVLEEGKPYAGLISAERGVQEDKGALGQIKKGVISSITETAKFIVTGQSVTKWIIKKAIERKINGEILKLKEEALKGALTDEQQDQLKFYTALSKNMEPIEETVSNIVVKALSRHDLSLHMGLVGYLGALSDNPQLDVDEKKLTEHLISSVEALFSEVDLYGDLIPGLLGAIASSQKLVV